jgi:uncharacterized protein YgbK (DUF1537 family)
MLTVLADDMTGAAEIAGVCLRRGLSVRFDFDFDLRSRPDADVWIIASDTRSLSESEACEAVRRTAQQLMDFRISHLFKKIDSVLRGHIVAEIEVLKAFFPIKNILLLPANPEAGRIIRDGCYFIDQKPLTETAFADDPDFPARTNVVRDLLGLVPQQTEYRTPDLTEPSDYTRHTLSPGTLPAGGSVFFEACLPFYFPAMPLPAAELPPAPLLRGRILMIGGSKQGQSRLFVQKRRKFTSLSIALSDIDLPASSERYETLLQTAVKILMRRKRLFLSVDDFRQSIPSPATVKALLARFAATLSWRCDIDELLIDGGATAYACIQAGGWATLTPTHEYARGVVRMRVAGEADFYITIKPGSYPWPKNLLNQ